jgi:hypothetical protein
MSPVSLGVPPISGRGLSMRSGHSHPKNRAV